MANVFQLERNGAFLRQQRSAPKRQLTPPTLLERGFIVNHAGRRFPLRLGVGKSPYVVRSRAARMMSLKLAAPTRSSPPGTLHSEHMPSSPSVASVYGVAIRV